LHKKLLVNQYVQKSQQTTYDIPLLTETFAEMHGHEKRMKTTKDGATKLSGMQKLMESLSEQ